MILSSGTSFPNFNYSFMTLMSSHLSVYARATRTFVVTVFTRERRSTVVTHIKFSKLIKSSSEDCCSFSSIHWLLSTNRHTVLVLKQQTHYLYYLFVFYSIYFLSNSCFLLSATHFLLNIIFYSSTSSGTFFSNC